MKVMTDDVYITLEKAAEVSFVEKKSEFIGNACPCRTEAEALAFIAQIRRKYADARHNVFAYQLKENNITRFTDDGEPQGTAGMPVLDIIRKTGFTDACIVVTRYFGGILLGTGGLVRAYSHAAKAAAEAAHIITYERFVVCSLICDYTDYGKLQAALPTFAVLTDRIDFAQDVTMRLAVRAAEFDNFSAAMIEITGGAVLLETEGERFDWIR